MSLPSEYEPWPPIMVCEPAPLVVTLCVVLLVMMVQR